MNIIEWEEQLDAVVLDDKHKRAAFKLLLAGPIDKKWQGKIVRSVRTNVDFHPPFTELRKTIWGTAVLLRVGYKSAKRFRPNVPDYPVVEMSMNGKTPFSQEQITELSIASAEAIRVVKLIREENSED